MRFIFMHRRSAAEAAPYSSLPVSAGRGRGGRRNKFQTDAANTGRVRWPGMKRKPLSESEQNGNRGRRARGTRPSRGWRKGFPKRAVPARQRFSALAARGSTATPGRWRFLWLSACTAGARRRSRPERAPERSGLIRGLTEGPACRSVRRSRFSCEAVPTISLPSQRRAAECPACAPQRRPPVQRRPCGHEPLPAKAGRGPATLAWLSFPRRRLRAAEWDCGPLAPGKGFRWYRCFRAGVS